MFAERRFGVRNRPQPFATVRNRLLWQKVAAPMGSFARKVIFGGFQPCVFAFRVAGALRDMWTCLVRCRKSFAWQAQYFGEVVRRCSGFFVAGAALWICPASFCVAGAALQTCRFVRIASLLREVVTKCKFRGTRGIL